MNVQLGTVSAGSAGPAAARTAPLPGAGSSTEAPTTQPPPQARAQAAVSVQQPMSEEAAKQVAREVNNYLKSSNSNLQFEVEQDSKHVIVRIVDSQTKELIRQIPSEEMLALSKSLDKLSGLLIQQKV